MIPALIVVLLIAALGAVPCALILGPARRRARALREWTPTTARIIGIADRSRAPLDVSLSRGRVHTLGVYEYAAPDGRHEGFIPLDGPWRADEERLVAIRFDPQNPSRSTEDAPFPSGLVGATIAFAVAIFGLAALMGYAVAVRFG